jgi:hypothetical protein
MLGLYILIRQGSHICFPNEFGKLRRALHSAVKYPECEADPITSV